MESSAETIDTEEQLGAFVAVIWECWNARKRFIFQKPDHNLGILGARVENFVKSY